MTLMWHFGKESPVSEVCNSHKAVLAFFFLLMLTFFYSMYRDEIEAGEGRAVSSCWDVSD